MTIAIVSKTNAAGLGVSYPRDPLIEDYGDAVRSLFDLGFDWSYPGGTKPRTPADPANAATIFDMSLSADNGSVTKQSGDTIDWDKGGFDFTNATKWSNYITAPGDFPADVYTAVSGIVQRYLWFAHIKLPASGDWNASSSVFPMAQFAVGSYTTGGAAELFVVAQLTSGGNKVLQLRRQTAAGSNVVTTSLTIPSGNLGGHVIVAVWRTDTETVIGIYDGTTWTTSATTTGTDNSANFSTLTQKIGTTPFGGTATISGYTNAQRFKVYRAAAINWARMPSGITPSAVVEADWARRVIRTTASAAANGGTSQIFN